MNNAANKFWERKVRVGRNLSEVGWQSGGMKKMLKTEIGIAETRKSRGQKPEGGGRKRPPFERMKKIFARLQDGKYPNCSTIAAEFAVSAKTAMRDLEFMRDRWELPIEYDKRRYGFYFAKRVERFGMEVIRGAIRRTFSLS